MAPLWLKTAYQWYIITNKQLLVCDAAASVVLLTYFDMKHLDNEQHVELSFLFQVIFVRPSFLLLSLTHTLCTCAYVNVCRHI